MYDNNRYFATLPTKEIGDALMERVEKYYRHIESSGRLALMQRSHALKHAATELYGQALQRTGDQGELVKAYVNHYANLINHRLNLTTDQRPSYEPKAINTDSESMIQVKLASGLLEYYERIKKMERHTARATEYALYLGEGFISTLWDVTAGEQFGVDPERGANVREGDLAFAAHHAFDVIRPLGPSQDWKILKLWRNRYDMVAKYPDLKDRIACITVDHMQEERFSFHEREHRRYDEHDDIPMYVFLHAKTEAMPDGRIVEFSAGDTVYVDGPLPYKEVPIFRIVESEQAGSILGYSSAFDLLPLQEAINNLVSTILTNQAAFGVQNIWAPSGGGYTVTSVMGGLNLITGDPKAGPPIPLQLTATAPEVFTMLDMLVHTMETISGVNSVARGNPEASLKSGAALALVQAQAIQFAQGLQRNYVGLLEDTGTSVVKVLQEYASTPRVALISGKSNRSYMKEFRGSDLRLITRVFVDMGSPLMRTTAGRTQMADAFLERGLIENPQQYLTVVSTGRLEPMYEAKQAELLLIRSENEQLSDGENPPVLVTDNHTLHVQEHLVVLSSPEARRDPRLVQTALDHISEHKQYEMPPAMPGQPPTVEGGDPSALLDNASPQVAAGQQAQLPEMPTNPLTGEQANGPA